MRTRSITYTIVLLLLGSILLSPIGTAAATLDAVPSASHVMAGNIVTVRVLVGSSNQAINNAEGVVSFPTEFLKVLSLDTSNSIFPLWIQGPSFSNVQGTVSFNGGVPSPGFIGTAGTIVAITFQAKKSGIATLALSNAAVRANDGLGTNVLQGTSNATLTIQDLPPSVPASVPSAKPTNAKPVYSSTIASTSPVVATTSVPTILVPTPTIEPSTHTPVEVQQFMQVGPFSVTLSFVVTVLIVLMLIQLGVALLSAYRLRVFKKGLGSGVLKSEKDIHKGFALLKDDLEQHLRQLGRARDAEAHTAEEEKLRRDLEGDIADLERFTRQGLETLRASLNKRRVDEQS